MFDLVINIRLLFLCKNESDLRVSNSEYSFKLKKAKRVNVY